MGPKIIFDTNVLISAVGWEGTSLQAVRRIASCTLLLSDEVLAEYRVVFGYRRFQFPQTKVNEFLASLEKQAIMISPHPLNIPGCRDPTDDKFLSLASAGGADFLVTGDTDLLSLGDFGKTRIVTPAMFVALFTEFADPPLRKETRL